MNTTEFLATILAPQDKYVLFLAKRAGATWNENYDTIEQCAAAIAKHDIDKNTTVYMAIGAFADNIAPHKRTGRDYTQRLKHQATRFKTLAVDLDVGEGSSKYNSPKEAALSLRDACAAIPLPQPLMVRSGGGIHAYWPFIDSVPANVWENMSLALRSALESEQVLLDVSKVSDRSMVLRPVGAHHKKNPDNWVKVAIIMGQPARPAIEYAQALAPFKDAKRKVSARGAKAFAKRQSSILEALLNDDPDIKIDDMRRCPQMEALLNSAGATDAAGNPVAEPLWRASLGIAKFCVDRADVAVMLSSGHADYAFETCMDKMEGWEGTGPANCRTFNDNCPGVCDNCGHYEKITSPAQLAGGVSVITVPDSDEADSDETDIQLPAGYAFKQNCLFYKHPVSEEEQFVAPYIMWVDSRVTDEEEESNSAMLAVVLPREGVKRIPIDAGLIAAGGVDLRKALADKQIYLKGDIDPLRNYMMTYLQSLQRAVAADVSYSHFGWQKDGSFLLGDKLIGNDAITTPHLQGVARSYADRLCSKGDLDTWTKASRLFDLPGMEFQNFAVMLALGAPLQQGAHFPSMLLNLYSSDSGSGKTLAGKFGLSAWGNPEDLGSKAKDTTAAFYKNIGTLSNMGGYIDEMTTMDTEDLRNFVMCIQDGKEKTRVRADASGFREQAKWYMPIISSSNKDMYEQLGKKLASEAEALRILQLTCPRVAYLADKGSRVGYKLQILMEQNYGLAGPLFIEEVVARGGPDAVYSAMEDEFVAEFGELFSGEERFYRGAMMIAYGAGKIYTELGLITCDYLRGIRAVLEEVQTLRVDRDLQALNGFDILAQFLTEHQADVVYYTSSPTNEYAMQPLPRYAVARVDIKVDASDTMIQGSMQVNRASFRKWASRNGADMRSTVEKLRDEGVSVTDNARRSLYRGCHASSSGQTRCFDIDIMSHPRLIAACDESAAGQGVLGRTRLEEVTTNV